MKICSNCGNKIFGNEKKCSVCKMPSKKAISVDENDKERVDEVIASVRAKGSSKPKKKSKLLPIAIVIIVLAVIGSMQGGDDTKETDAPNSNSLVSQKDGPQSGEEELEEIYEIGESFDSGKLGVEILNVEEKTEFKSDNQFIKNVTTEGKFISVKAKLTNNDTEARMFSSTMFKIIDNQERKFETLTDVNLMMILGDDDLFFESCNPGMSRTGVFVFEVPSDIESYYLEVLSGTAFAAKTSTKVKLK